jgi:hypothetical protein
LSSIALHELFDHWRRRRRRRPHVRRRSDRLAPSTHRRRVVVIIVSSSSDIVIVIISIGVILLLLILVVNDHADSAVCVGRSVDSFAMRRVVASPAAGTGASVACARAECTRGCRLGPLCVSLAAAVAAAPGLPSVSLRADAWLVLLKVDPRPTALDDLHGAARLSVPVLRAAFCRSAWLGGV